MLLLLDIIKSIMEAELMLTYASADLVRVYRNHSCATELRIEHLSGPSRVRYTKDQNLYG